MHFYQLTGIGYTLTKRDFRPFKVIVVYQVQCALGVLRGVHDNTAGRQLIGHGDFFTAIPWCARSLEEQLLYTSLNCRLNTNSRPARQLP